MLIFPKDATMQSVFKTLSEMEDIMSLCLEQDLEIFVIVKTIYAELECEWDCYEQGGDKKTKKC